MVALYGWSRSEDMSHWLNADGTKYRTFTNHSLEDDVENPYWIINRNSLSDRNERLTGAVFGADPKQDNYYPRRWMHSPN